MQIQAFNTLNNNLTAIPQRVYQDVVQPVMQNIYPDAVNCVNQALLFSPNYVNSLIVPPPQRVYPKVNNPFDGVTEEERNLPREERNKVLFEKGKLLELSRCGSDTNCEVAYTILKDNEDFNELLNSKFFSKQSDKAEVFVKLVNIMESLRKQRENRLINDYLKFYYSNCLVLTYSNYELSNIGCYANYLNNFVKNEHLSDDLKEYYIDTQADKLEVYNSRLDNLQNDENDLELLTTKNPPFKYMLQ